MYAGSGCVIARTAGEGRDIATTAFFGAVVVSLAVALAVGGLVVVQRLVPLSLRETHNAATGTIFAALYVLFGVTVGFSLLLVWQQYDAAEKVTAREAATVEELYRLAGDLPEPDRGRVQGLAESYARVVMEEEWPLMRDGGTSPRAGELAVDLRESIQGFEPRTENERALRSEGLTQLDNLDEDRALRLLEVREGLPPPHVGSLGGGGCDHGRLHLPLRAGDALVARARGRRPDSGRHPHLLHHSRTRLPL